ncbi:MAG: SDR family oxidoreductase [Pseudomonadota bacterium]
MQAEAGNSEGTTRLDGRTALVTAAGQGIGRAVAARLIRDGAEVHASDINGEALAGLDAVTARAVDAADESAVDRWIAAFDQIDIVVHAAGYVHHGTVEDCTMDDWRRSLSITLDSAYFVFRHAVPRMKVTGGSVITIASVASSTKGFPKRAAYGAAKGGVIGLVKACAADYLNDGIRFNAVCPGTVDTPSLRGRIAALAPQLGGMQAAEDYFTSRQPSGRFGTPDEIAGMCAFLASDDSRFMTGQVVNVDGGITI